MMPPQFWWFLGFGILILIGALCTRGEAHWQKDD